MDEAEIDSINKKNPKFLSLFNKKITIRHTESNIIENTTILVKKIIKFIYSNFTMKLSFFQQITFLISIFFPPPLPKSISMLPMAGITQNKIFPRGDISRV